MINQVVYVIITDDLYLFIDVIMKVLIMETKRIVLDPQRDPAVATLLFFATKAIRWTNVFLIIALSPEHSNMSRS